VFRNKYRPIISIAFYFKTPHFDRLSETISRALIKMQMTARNFEVITSVVKIAIKTLEVSKTKIRIKFICTNLYPKYEN